MSSAALPPFTPRGVSAFNSAFETYLPNVLLSGALVFLVLLELESVAEQLVHATSALSKRSVDAYLLYSRACSLRAVVRTVVGVEWPVNQVATVSRDRFQLRRPHRPLAPPPLAASPPHAASPPPPPRSTPRGVPVARLRPRRLLLPLLVRAALLALQLLAIYFSSPTTRDVPVTPNFDLQLSNDPRAAVAPTDAPAANVSDAPACRRYIRRARGVEQLGDVLLCITSREARRFDTPQPRTALRFHFCARENRFEFAVRDGQAMESQVSVRARLFFLSGENAGVAPLRPDLPSERGRAAAALIKRVMLNALRAHGVRDGVHPAAIHTVRTAHTLSYNLLCPPRAACDRVALSDALLRELRSLRLAVNESADSPHAGVWLFSTRNGYQLERSRAIAVVSSNRIAQGWLLIIWLVLLLARSLAATRWRHFEELGYIAVKRLHGEPVALGPLALTEYRAPLFVRKFSDGRVGHIGFRPAAPRQRVVDTFHGCELVLGARRDAAGAKR